MSYGSNEAVKDAEEAYRDECAQLVAEKAAQLVAAGDMGRAPAVEQSAEWLRQEGEAESDETGTLAVENTPPSPSKVKPTAQVTAIAAELLDDARDAVASR